MKANILTTMCLLMGICTLAIAQPELTDTALAKIVYQFTHIDDSTQRDKPRQEDMVLYLGNHASLYRRVIEEESNQALHQMAGGSAASFDLNDILDKSAAQIHFSALNQSHTVERIIENMYLISEGLPRINWHISEETKEIEGYSVQKATARFRGRDYTAWFAPEIPFPFGPWKLHGLPGVILEAEDSKREVIFKYAGFETLEKGGIRIVLPKNIKKVSQKEYDKIHTAFLADPASFIKATTGATNVASGRRIGGGGAASKPKELNNPIELSENE